MYQFRLLFGSHQIPPGRPLFAPIAGLLAAERAGQRYQPVTLNDLKPGVSRQRVAPAGTAPARGPAAAGGPVGGNASMAFAANDFTPNRDQQAGPSPAAAAVAGGRGGMEDDMEYGADFKRAGGGQRGRGGGAGGRAAGGVGGGWNVAGGRGQGGAAAGPPGDGAAGFAGRGRGGAGVGGAGGAAAGAGGGVIVSMAPGGMAASQASQAPAAGLHPQFSGPQGLQLNQGGGGGGGGGLMAMPPQPQLIPDQQKQAGMARAALNMPDMKVPNIPGGGVFSDEAIIQMLMQHGVSAAQQQQQQQQQLQQQQQPTLQTLMHALPISAGPTDVEAFGQLLKMQQLGGLQAAAVSSAFQAQMPAGGVLTAAQQIARAGAGGGGGGPGVMQGGGAGGWRGAGVPTSVAPTGGWGQPAGSAGQPAGAAAGGKPAPAGGAWAAMPADQAYNNSADAW